MQEKRQIFLLINLKEYTDNCKPNLGHDIPTSGNRQPNLGHEIPPSGKCKPILGHKIPTPDN